MSPPSRRSWRSSTPATPASPSSPPEPRRRTRDRLRGVAAASPHRRRRSGGFVDGLYRVPEGIGYASLARMSPVLGINAGMVPVATGIGRRIGEENLVAPDPHLDVAIGHGLQRGDELLHELRQRDEPERGQDAP